MDPKITNNPELYHKLSQPFESAEEANKSLAAFHAELSLLRQKHKLPDMLVVVMADTKYEDGNIGQFFQQFGFGSQQNQAILAAYAHGKAQADFRQLINKLASGTATANRI